ncbi:hypothetical protein Tco_1122230 [Tanacetum coccineum]|uniref:Uncharacterized protein n=1 Tax=Tanacetum coccineum TaxID=301880 RepID=A0ABQ5J1E7_9ASTR
MLIQPQGASSTSSPSNISSSPYQSSEPTPNHTSVTEPSPSLIGPQQSQPSPAAEDHVTSPNESPLHAVNSHESDEGSLKLNELMNLVTKLSDKIGDLEDELKNTKLTYSSAFTKLILRVKKLEKEGRKLSDDQNDGVEWFQDTAEVQDKSSDETELVLQEETPTEVIHDQRSSEKDQSEVSTAGATQGTASEVPVVSTAEVDISTASEIRRTSRRIVYSRRSSEETRKDKGKAIMTEPEPKKKSKKEIEQEILSLAESIRLQEQIDKEQRAQIARDEEIAKQ